MIFLVMAPFGPLYFLEKHRRRPAPIAPPGDQVDRVFLDGSKAQRSEP
jgi:hypothetical protein